MWSRTPRSGTTRPGGAWASAISTSSTRRFAAHLLPSFRGGTTPPRTGPSATSPASPRSRATGPGSAWTATTTATPTRCPATAACTSSGLVRADKRHHVGTVRRRTTGTSGQTVALSFLVNRPATEPGFRLGRQEAADRRIRYTTHAYLTDRPAEARYTRA